MTTVLPTSKYSAVSLFSGCGGSDIGMRNAGIETIWSNDISESACELYQRITGASVINCGDIAGYLKTPQADILAGCYPCQGYSQAGNRQADLDNRNFLYRQFGRILKQSRPLAFIVENVDGIRFSQNQPLFNRQLRYFRTAGYRVFHKVLAAKDYGLAQDRKRMFIVGIRTSEKKSFEFPEPTHGTELAPYKTLKDVIWRYRKAPTGSFNMEPFHWYYLSRNRRREWHQQAPCVVAHWRHVGLHPDSMPLRKVKEDHWEFVREGMSRRFSYLECAAIQGFPDPNKFEGVPVRERFRAIGNAVPPPLFEAVSKALVEQL